MGTLCQDPAIPASTQNPTHGEGSRLCPHRSPPPPSGPTVTQCPAHAFHGSKGDSCMSAQATAGVQPRSQHPGSHRAALLRPRGLALRRLRTLTLSHHRQCCTHLPGKRTQCLPSLATGSPRSLETVPRRAVRARCRSVAGNAPGDSGIGLGERGSEDPFRMEWGGSVGAEGGPSAARRAGWGTWVPAG